MTELGLGSGSGTGSDDGRDGSASDDSDVLALELDRLITEYFDAQREGRAPSVDDYVALHPEHEHALRAVLPGANLLDQIGKRAEDHTPASRSGDRLGEYKLLGILGRGGMGVVYEAVQESLGRPVALKVLPASRVVDRKSRERFMREAQAAASLQHPGIVPVYGVGEADGQVYYAMQRVDGVPLDVLTAAMRGDDTPSESTALVERAAGLAARLRGDGSSTVRSAPSTSSVSIAGELDSVPVASRPWITTAVRVAQQVAEALSYAHSRGVLHRDVKPSNVMLDEAGRAYVTDFGLCKTADTSSLTAAGDVVGTLRYVPPERFQGRDDARGDVYGVGMILYELLCSRPAFPQRDRATLVQAVTLESPTRPRRLNADIPQDLERIVLTATAKLPEERYASAEALMADLAAFLDGRPIRARAPGKLYLARLFARRHRGLVATLTASLLVLTIGTIVYLRDLGSLVREVEAGRAMAERATYAARLNAAMEATETWHKGASRAKRFLLEVPPEQRDWLWDVVYARSDTAFQIVDHGMDPVTDAVLDGSQEYVAALRPEGVRVHRIDGGELLFEAPVWNGGALAFVPGTRDVVVIAGRELHWFGANDGALAGRTLDLRRGVESLELTDVRAIDSDRDRFVLSCRDGRVAVFDVTGGSQPVLHEGLAGATVITLFGGDGRVALAGRNRGLRVVGPAPGDVRALPDSTQGRLLDLDGASDAPCFAAATSNGLTVRFEDDPALDALERWAVLTRDTALMYCAIAPDGDSVISLVRSGRSRMWTAERGSSPIKALGYTARPTAVMWPGGGDDFIVAGRSGGWRRMPTPGYVEPTPGVSEFRGSYSHAYEFVLDPSGAFLAQGDGGGAFAVWDVKREKPVVAVVDVPFPIREVALDVLEDGTMRFVSGDAVLGIWSIPAEDREAHEMTRFDDFARVQGVEFVGPTRGDRLVMACDDGSIWELRKVDASPDGTGWSRRLAFQLDGEPTVLEHHRATGLSLVGLADGRILRFDLAGLESGRFESFALLADGVATLGIGPLAECAVAVSRDHVLTKLDLSGRDVGARWSKRVAQPGTELLGWTAAAIDEASGWIVTASADGVVQTWDVETGLFGPTLEPRYGKYSDTLFPGAGVPPMTLEFRGRITRYDRKGVSRLRELARIRPTEAEQRALDRLSAGSRVEQIEAGIADPALDPRRAVTLRNAASGLEFYSRFFPTNIAPQRAQRALREIEELVGPGESPD